MKHLKKLFSEENRKLFLFMLFCFPLTILAQTTFTGNVKDDLGIPLPGASTYLEGTTSGGVTDFDGNYSFTTDITGDVTLIVSSVGYSTQKFSFTVQGGETIQQDVNFEADILGLDEIVLTGSAGNPKSKLESSVAISSLGIKKIQNASARGTAELYKTLPGVFVNASGGEGNANIEIRGNPNNGGGKFTQVQEDGLPVLPFSDIAFGNVDMFTRVDNTISRVENIRGGSAAIFASNAANGIINTISKTGRTQGGSIAQQIGLDYNHFRTDFEYGSPINEDLFFHMGGFYRTNEGIRSPGYTANQGGQIKFNMTKQFENGFVRVYMKHLDDNTIPYIPIPLARDGDVNDNKVKGKSLPGFDANYGTFHSVDLLRFKAQTPFGGLVEESLEGGMEPQLFAFGAEADFDLGNNWSVNNKFRKSTIVHEFNGIFSFSGQPLSAADFAASKNVTDFTYSYESGQGAGDPLTPAQLNGLNGNGLVVEYGYWNVDQNMDFFVNDFKINKKFESFEGNLTVGYYRSQFNLEQEWWWHNVLADVSDNTRRLNLIDNTSGESLTVDGVSQFGSLYKNSKGESLIDAPYANFEWTPVENLNIDAGVRLDIGRTVGQTNAGVGSGYDYDVDGDGVISAAETGVLHNDGEFIPFNFRYKRLSYSIGVNYKFNDNNAAFARHSEGSRFNFDRAYNFDATNATASGFPTTQEDGEKAIQYELGYKYKSQNFGAFVTGFHTRYPDNIFNELVDNGSGGFENATAFGLIKVTGVEIETRAAFGNFNIGFNGTFFKRLYGDRIIDNPADPGNPLDLSGEEAPGVNSYFTLSPEYNFNENKFLIGANILYRGKFDDSDFDDAFFAPYVVFNPYLRANLSDKFSILVNASNLFNSLGIDEGNSRTTTSAVGQDVFFARPILGRSIQTTFIYSF